MDRAAQPGFSVRRSRLAPHSRILACGHRALAEAIARVLMDARLRMHLAHGARDRAEHFTWERVGDRIVELYDRVRTEHREKIAL